MEDFQKANKVFEEMSILKEGSRRYVLARLMAEEKISIIDLVSTRENYLLKFKSEAKYDIRILSQAGLSLGEKAIKNIPKIKDERKKKVAIAQAQSLLAGQGYCGTKFEEDLKKVVGDELLDDEWYIESWGIKNRLWVEES